MRSALLSGLIALWVSALRVAAQSDEGALAERAFPENNEVRNGLVDIIRAPAFEAALAVSSLHGEQATGLEVKFSVVTEGGDLYLLFINQSKGSFTIENAGSWVIKRSAVDGSFLQAKIFLNGDPGSFMRLFPDHDRTRMDLYLYGYPIYKDVIVPIDFYQLLTEPVTRIMDGGRAKRAMGSCAPKARLLEDRMVERASGAAANVALPLPLLHRCDVRSVPFLRFVADRGYPIHQLKLSLYLLAMEEPGNYYLGFLSPPPESGGWSQLRGWRERRGHGRCCGRW